MVSRCHRCLDQATVATVKRRGNDTPVVDGCVLFVCRQQVWRRASWVAEALR